jgi:uncharacterized protein YggU (UPF0235/DUF167 family)
MGQQSLYVKVHPNAGTDVLVATAPDRAEAWVKAKPIDGQANDAVARLIARSFSVAPAQVKLVKGASGRRKVYRIIT